MEEGGSGGGAGGVDTAAHTSSNNFFPFNPKNVLEDVQNAVDDYIADASDEIEAALLDQCGKEGAIAAEIRAGTDELHTKLAQKFQEKFAILGNYAERNIFNVDPDLVVPVADETAARSESGSATSDVEVTKEDEAKLDAKLKAATQRLQKAKQQKKGLDARRQKISKLQTLFERHTDDIAEIKKLFGRRGKKGDFTKLASAVATLKGILKDVSGVQKQLQRNAAKAGIKTTRAEHASSSSAIST